MESTQLSEFYRNTTSWPVNPTELAAAVERIARLLGLPFVALYRADGESRGAWRVEGLTGTPDPGSMDEFLRSRLQSARALFSGVSGSAPVIRQLQLNGERRPWSSAPTVTHLAITNISGTLPPEASSAVTVSGRARVDYAWLIAGASRPLSSKEEILCLAAAAELAAMAELACLENGIQLRNQFLSIASHELKTPLTSIYGVLQLQERMLRLKKDEPPETQIARQESYLKMVIRQTQRLNELIDGLLDLSRIQNGRFLVEPSDTEVGALVRETISGRLAVIAQEAGVSLNLDAPEALHAWVDPVRLEETVTNLVMNAIRFSPEGGVVWIKVRAANGSLHLTVRDQGPCIPPADRERIFQPFERAQRTARFGGLGLGLYISRQIARLHGGDVALTESVQGKGNVLEATFPLKAPGAAGAAGAATTGSVA